MEPAPPGDPTAVPPVPDPPLSTSNTRCHVYSCSSDSSTITITSSYPTVPGFSVVCGKTDAGAIKTVTYSTYTLGTITCPTDYKRFCNNKTCKNFCSFNGICVRGLCFCNPGRNGDDCSTTCPNYSDSGSCVTSCPTGKYANMDNVINKTTITISSRIYPCYHSLNPFCYPLGLPCYLPYWFLPRKQSLYAL